jgi:hypothetical protein
MSLQKLYIFKRGRLCNDYLQQCKTKNLNGYANKNMDDKFPFQRFLFFFKKLIRCGIFLNNRHLLVSNGHGSHVTLEVIEQAQKFGLDMIILPSHTSHVFQPLNVAYFKPFKTTFRRKKMVQWLETIIANHTR